MSLRKFMHPRNKYKKIPDFKQLAVLYPEFRKVVKQDLTGKIHVDFKNEKALRVLTETLLKHDFKLSVDIPPKKLVPTLPLRLNYVLWIEDLMTYASFKEMEVCKGIDIGTGAICIYPLLLANMYRCHMIGTEIDETSVQTAMRNVEKNDLQHLIKIVLVKSETILKSIVEKDENYHFTMCNPPFFELDKSSGKPHKRLPPRNAPTGNETECTIEGGEKEFVTRMIDESLQVRDKIKIYTTMLGQKQNLLFLTELLAKKHIENFTWTEFCQGHTKRWGLAWTHMSKDTLDLTKAPSIRTATDPASKSLRNSTDIIFPVREDLSSVSEFIQLLKEWSTQLNVEMKESGLHKNPQTWSCQLIAQSDTWSHARRKRRLAQRLSTQNTEEQKDSTSNTISEMINYQETGSTALQEKQSNAGEPFLTCSLFVKVKENFEICMILDKEGGNKDALERLRQSLANKLRVREHLKCSKSKKRRKGLKKTRKRPRYSVDTSRVAAESSHSFCEDSTGSS